MRSPQKNYGRSCSLHSDGTGGLAFEALWNKTRNRAFDGDLVVVVVAMFGMKR